MTSKVPMTWLLPNLLARFKEDDYDLKSERKLQHLLYRRKHEGTLIDAIIMLANAFREARYNPPRKLEVDSQTFDKLLAEAMELYDIDSKKAIIEHRLPIADISTIIEEY